MFIEDQTSLQKNILVVDDDHDFRWAIGNVLQAGGYKVTQAQDGEEALRSLEENVPDLILLDYRMPRRDGISVSTDIKKRIPALPIIMITAYAEIKSAVEAIKTGVYDYVAKPIDNNDLLFTIKRAMEKQELVQEVERLRNVLNERASLYKLMGNSDCIGELYKLVKKVAPTSFTVLIEGESGTGKELVARAIHNRGLRHKEPFVVINCSAIPATLMESKIFGHNRGAFTGATHTSIGKLEIADKGTVFLDDIDSLDINMQAKLLRIIQEKEFERLGSTKVIKVDVRFVASSNKDLNDLILQEGFREDLYYRLAVFPIELPPLRERKGDIPLLLNHFLELNSMNTGKPPKIFSEEAVNILTEYDWPGNVRELQNLVERLFAITKGSVIHLKAISTFNIGKREIKDMTLKQAVSVFEKNYISEVLESVDGNRKKAAERLGIHRNTLLSKTIELGLNTNK